ALNSVDRIVAEPGPGAAVVVDNFVPTSGTPFKTATATVKVTDGKLTLNALGGGVNTKLDFLDVVPNIPPVVAVPTRVTGRLSPTTGSYFGATSDTVPAIDDTTWESR